MRVSFAAPPSPEEVSYCKIRQKCIARIHFLDSSASTGFGSAGEQTLETIISDKVGNKNRIFEYAPKPGAKYELFQAGGNHAGGVYCLLNLWHLFTYLPSKVIKYAIKAKNEENLCLILIKIPVRYKPVTSTNKTK